MIEEWVDGVFDAAHRAPYGAAVHGHTWRVRVFWAADGRDAGAMKVALDQTLEAGFDHRMLDDMPNLEPSNAGIAQALHQLLGHLFHEVWVWRDGGLPCGARVRL